MRRYHKKRYEYSSLNHNLHFETTADSRGEEATLTVVEEVAVEEAMTEVIDEVLEEMTEVEQEMILAEVFKEGTHEEEVELVSLNGRAICIEPFNFMINFSFHR